MTFNDEEEWRKESTRILASTTIYLLFQKFKTESGLSHAQAFKVVAEYVGEKEMEYAKSLTNGNDFKQVSEIARQVLQEGLAEQRVENIELGVKPHDS